jgi:hypothetical protein
VLIKCLVSFASFVGPCISCYSGPATADTLVRRDDLIFTSSLLPFIVVSSVAMLFSRGGEGANGVLLITNLAVGIYNTLDHTLECLSI